MKQTFITYLISKRISYVKIWRFFVTLSQQLFKIIILINIIIVAIKICNKNRETEEEDYQTVNSWNLTLSSRDDSFVADTNQIWL